MWTSERLKWRTAHCRYHAIRSIENTAQNSTVSFCAREEGERRLKLGEQLPSKRLSVVSCGSIYKSHVDSHVGFVARKRTKRVVVEIF